MKHGTSGSRENVCSSAIYCSHLVLVLMLLGTLLRFYGFAVIWAVLKPFVPV